MMCLILGTRVQVQVLNPCKSVQESSEEVLFFKAQQIARQMFLLRFEIWSSTVVSIDNYKNQFFRFDFTHIYVYVFRFSFLTTLDIYKDYFKDCHKVIALVVACILWPETIALVYLSLEETVAFVCYRVLWPMSFMIFIVWMN